MYKHYLKNSINLDSLKKNILAISYIMKVSEVGHSHNQFQMVKWNPVIEVGFMSEESFKRLSLTVEVLELLSIHMLPRDPLSQPFIFSQLDQA